MSCRYFRSEVRRALLVVACCAAVSIGLGGGEAHAQESAGVAEELSQEATEHYRRSIELYKEGEYDRAVDELRAAYSLTPDPMLLYNMALAHAMAGDVEAARRAALRAQADGLPARMAPYNDARIRGFGTILTAREMAEAMGSPAVEAPRAAVAAPEVSEPRDEAASEESSGSMSALGWTGTALAATGAAALGGAWFINAQLVDDSAPLREAAASGDSATVYEFRQNELDDLEQKQTVGQVLLVGGTVLATTGATLLLVDLLGDESAAQVSLTGGLSAGGAAAGIRVGF